MSSVDLEKMMNLYYDRNLPRNITEEVLNSSGVDVNWVNERDSNKRLLMRVMEEKPAMEEDEKLEIVKLLLAKGADINAKDKYGRTALFPAYKNKNNKIIVYLLENGALANTKDINGKTVDDYAEGRFGGARKSKRNKRSRRSRRSRKSRRTKRR
jgi:ankyrin repeat protein